MFSEIFSKLLQEKDVSTYKLTKDTGISNGMISKWKNGAQIPSAENLSKLADYFDVSVDYLLGRTDIREVNRRDNVEIKYYERLNAAGRQKVEEYIRDLSENPKYTKPDTSDDEHPSLLFSLIQRAPKH